MDIGVTISKVRKEYREYLRETHPDWADTTISTHVSDAFYLYQNTIALSFWKCFESDASMEKAKGEIFDYLKQEVMIKVPDLDVQHKISSHLAAMDRRIEHTQQELNALIEHRRGIMQQLFI